MLLYTLENLLLVLSLVAIVIVLYYAIDRAVDLFSGDDPAPDTQTQKIRGKKNHVGSVRRHLYTGLHFGIPKQSAGHPKRS